MQRAHIKRADALHLMLLWELPLILSRTLGDRIPLILSRTPLKTVDGGQHAPELTRARAQACTPACRGPLAPGGAASQRRAAPCRRYLIICLHIQLSIYGMCNRRPADDFLTFFRLSIRHV